MIKDSNNTPISVGDTVIYNLSGALAKGKIWRIVEKWDKRPYLNSHYFTGFIEITYISGGELKKPVGSISKVRNPMSIFIIEQSAGQMENNK